MKTVGYFVGKGAVRIEVTTPEGFASFRGLLLATGYREVGRLRYLCAVAWYRLAGLCLPGSTVSASWSFDEEEACR